MQEISKEELIELTGHSPLILDIGSYDGKDGYEVAKLGAHVHCFEPVNFDNFMSHENMVLHPYAIGAEDKITVMNCSPHKQSNSLRKPKTHLELFPEVKYTHRESVEMMRIDTWYKGFSTIKYTPKIDLIWADVNGSEGDLIKGAQKVLSITRFLFIETSDKELFEGQITTDELLKLLPGWKVLGIYNHLGNFGNILLQNDI